MLGPPTSGEGIEASVVVANIDQQEVTCVRRSRTASCMLGPRALALEVEVADAVEQPRAVEGELVGVTRRLEPQLDAIGLLTRGAMIELVADLIAARDARRAERVEALILAIGGLAILLTTPPCLQLDARDKPRQSRPARPAIEVAIEPMEAQRGAVHIPQLGRRRCCWCGRE